MSQASPEQLERDDEETLEVVDHKRRVLFSGASLAIFGYLAWMSYEMPLGTSTSPGPGFFPLLVAILGVVGSALMLLESILKSRHSPESPRKDRTARLAWLLVVYVIGLAAALPVLGIYIGGTIFAALCVKTFGSTSYLKSALYGVLIGGILAFMAVDVIGIRIQAWPGL